MPLIIDSYEVSALDISKSIFKRSEIVELSLPILDVLDPDKIIYYFHRENEYDLRKIKYLFNEIVEVENNLIYINKKKKIIKYYSVLFEHDSVSFSEITDDKESSRMTVDKSSFLPHLKAQEDEIVIFPNEEDDDE